MTWMNQWDVEEARERWAGHPSMGPATQTLFNLMTAVNLNSDGWPYWNPPSRAASKLQELIQQANQHARQAYQSPRAEMPTAAQIKKSYAPIKAFMTRRGNAAGMSVEFVEPREEAKV